MKVNLKCPVCGSSVNKPTLQNQRQLMLIDTTDGEPGFVNGAVSYISAEPVLCNACGYMMFFKWGSLHEDSLDISE